MTRGARRSPTSASRRGPARRSRLVGATGSGKSTTLNLLHRVFDPTEGQVTIDGRDIRSMTLESLRENIGVVFQEPFIFARSIEENLRIGKPDATEAEMERALEAAQAMDFVRRAPNGLKAVIGERGRNLSGGERQRLSIARALLKDPPIMVLDEATSALDAETERQVQAAVDAAMRGPHDLRHRPPARDHPQRRSDSGVRLRAASSSGGRSTSSLRGTAPSPRSPGRSS